MLASARVSLGTGVLLCATLALTACAARHDGAPAPAAPPRVVTVPQLKTMVAQGMTMGAIFGEIQGSGTVYRLTNRQAKDLRADGMPASLIGFMDATYEHAIRQNPELGKSDTHWTEIDGYWYGGLPYGWPREWVGVVP